MHLISNADSLEFITNSWWLASTRSHDCADDKLTMLAVRDTFLALRLNERSPKIVELADKAVQEMYARRGAA